MKKTYNNCSDVEKHILREHSEWKKSDCDIAYKLSQVGYWRKRAEQDNISHLL